MRGKELCTRTMVDGKPSQPNHLSTTSHDTALVWEMQHQACGSGVPIQLTRESTKT
jgi:hypothetical protein